jgi:beta-glucosidase
MKITHRLLASIASAALMAASAPGIAQGTAAGAYAQAPEENLSARVLDLISRMTIEEKLNMTQGQPDIIDQEQPGYTPGVPRLGIPPLRWVDGPGGIDNLYEATSLPQPISLASTFDPALAYRYGVINGRETRATNMDVFLGPMVNIARIPNWGRNATSMGEDPYLMAVMAAPIVKGIQEQGVIASTKHFVGNNQAEGVDSNRHEVIDNDFVIDLRTLHEIYLSGFESAVDAGTGSIMTAYNQTNGYPNAGNPDTLNGILRGELGFRGFVESDWGAVHSTDSILKGLDAEFTGYGIFNKKTLYFGDALRAAIDEGTVPIAALDRSVGRILSVIERMGMLDHTRVPGPEAIEIEAGAEVARLVAERGTVLLANDGILPLREEALQSLALIGPTAGQLAANPGFGSALGITERKISPLDAMRGAGANVTHARGQNLHGEPIPATYVMPTGGNGRGFMRIPQNGTAVSVDPAIDFTGDNALPFGRAYTWRGTLTVPETGEYVLMTQSWGGRSELFVDGEVASRSAYPFFGGAAKKTSSLLPTPDGLDNGRAVMQLEANRAYEIEVQAQAWADDELQVRLNWYTPEMRRADMQAAVDAARSSHTAVVFAWQRAGEQADPDASLRLPEHQDELIEAVINANPNTVVLLTSGPVQMPWLEDARAVMEIWYPGQEGGLAIADLLTGRANPSGKLPITFPREITDSPAFAPGHPERYLGVDDEVRYTEGIFVGYRWFDEQDIEPLFPFGHGLSYTNFGYSDLEVLPSVEGLEVRFSLTNTGGVAGAEVPQVYVSRPDSTPVPMAVRALAGFERVELAPGETREIVLQVSRRQMSYWNVDARSWEFVPGERTIWVGSSSRDLRLDAEATPRG